MIPVLTTGVPNLDEILGGGLPTGAMTLILGVPGSGKTILAEQIAVHQAKGGAQVLIFTALSESHDRLLAALREFSFADEALIGDALRYLSVQATLSEGLAVTAETIVTTARLQRATFVALDGLHSLTGFANSGREVLDFLYTLRTRLSLLGITTVVTYETGLDESSESGVLTIADGIIRMYNTLTEERHHRRLAVQKLRGMNPLDGLHSITITRDGITCYPRQEAAYRAMRYAIGEKRMSLGLPELDAMMMGGPNEGTTTFLAGSPGTGKTLTSLHFAMAGVARDEPALFVGLSESAEQLYLKAHNFGLDLTGAVARGTVSLMSVSPAELDVDVLAARIREQVEGRGIRRLVIDTVAVVEQEIPFRSRTLRYLSSLLDYLREHGVTTVLTQDSAAFDGGGMSQSIAAMLADNMLVLRLVEYRNSLYRILSVRKMRQSGFDAGLREFRIEAGIVRVLPVAESVPGILDGIITQEQREARMTRRNKQD